MTVEQVWAVVAAVVGSVVAIAVVVAGVVAVMERRARIEAERTEQARATAAAARAQEAAGRQRFAERRVEAVLKALAASGPDLVGAAHDEVRVLGPGPVEEAMGAYVAAMAAGAGPSAAAEPAGTVAEARARLVEAARAAGLGEIDRPE